MSGVEWRGAGVTRECTWNGTIPRMYLIVIALNANFNSVPSVEANEILSDCQNGFRKQRGTIDHL